MYGGAGLADECEYRFIVDAVPVSVRSVHGDEQAGEAVMRGIPEPQFIDASKIAVLPGRYWYWLEENTLAVDQLYYGPQRVLISGLRSVLSLAQNAPNPFFKTTEVALSIHDLRPVNLGVYDVSGRLVCRLVCDHSLSVGEHRRGGAVARHHARGPMR